VKNSGETCLAIVERKWNRDGSLSSLLETRAQQLKLIGVETNLATGAQDLPGCEHDQSKIVLWVDCWGLQVEPPKN
jgi:hypothetical protein